MTHVSTPLCVVLALLGLSACVDSSIPSVPATPQKDVIVDLSVSPSALLMAVDDSVQLTLLAKNILGETFPIHSVEGASPITWTLSDSSKVSIGPNNFLKARSSTSEDFVTVTGEWSHKSSTNTVSVLVNITPTQLPIDSIKIVPKDSARSSGTTPALEAASWFWIKAMNATGDSIAAPRIPVVAADTIPISKVIPLYLGPLGTFFGGASHVLMTTVIGDFWLYARSNVYGVSMEDSVKYTGLYPVTADVIINRDSTSNTFLSPSAGHEIFVQPCAFVSFKNGASSPIDIVFDDPNKTGKCLPVDQTGNIENLAPGQTQIRKFPALGTIVWTLRNPATGQLMPSVRGKVTMRDPN